MPAVIQLGQLGNMKQTNKPGRLLVGDSP